jgi:two-component system, sporulation sensor kinase A
MSSGPTTPDYRTIIESAPEAIVVYTPEKFLFLNSFAAEQLGSDPASLVGRSIMEFVHPDSAPVVINRIRDVLKSGVGGGPLEVRFVSLSGTVIPAEIVSVPIIFEEQQAFLGLIRDISNRAEMERALRESEEKFGNAFRHSPHGMGFVGRDGSWLKANRALCEMLGYSEEELLQRRVSDITHPDDVSADVEQLNRLMSGEIASYHLTKRYYRKDGRVIWASLAVAPVHNEEGVPIYFIGQVQDITLEREREEQRAHGERLAGITETTIAVAHEMNNELTVLMMNAELLADKPSPEEIPEIAAEILSAASSIAATVQRLRKLGVPESVEYLGEDKMLDLSPKRARKPLKRGK